MLWKEFLQFKITPKQFECLWEKVRCIELKRGQVFSEEFSICKRLGYLVFGELSAFGSDINGKKTTSQFFYRPGNRVVTSFTSFNSEISSIESIKALSPCVLLFITFDDLKAVCHVEPCFHEIARKIGGRQLMISAIQIAALKQLDATEQIEALNNDHKIFFNVPFRSQLVSYTGIGRSNLISILKALGI